jgi:S-phase kinase-associated protein 1
MDEPDSNETLNDPIPLANVNGAILRKVIQWCQYHKDDPAIATDSDSKERRTDDICSWDVEFLKVDQGTLFELILAANYLDGKSLMFFKSIITSFQSVDCWTWPARQLLT